MTTLRRRTFKIDTPDGCGEVAGVEAGPQHRSLDLLFLHANGFNAFTYAPILASLAQARRVLAVDLRGHGHTRLPQPAIPQGWRIYGRDLLALLRVLGEQPCVLAGHSMGGTAALLAAPDLPGVRSVVLFDPVIMPAAIYAEALRKPDMDFPMAQAALRRNAHFASRDEALAAYRGRGGFRTWPEEFLRAYLQDGLTETEDGVTLSCAPSWEAANFASYAIDDPVPGLPRISATIRILRAENGSTCALSEPVADAVLSIETVPGTSHFLPMERADLVVEAVIQPE
jgi:pimeloyl-ACP methyl ester carboxylesterase